MHDADIAAELQQDVLQASSDGTPLVLRGGGSKAFLGRSTSGRALDVSGHRGIIDYDPHELVITARSGTPLTEIETVLTAAGQMLAFEPPHFGATATLGGTLACGLN